MKVGCVVQGDIRRGSEEVLRELPRHFGFVVLSTWNDDQPRIPSGQFEVILSEKPNIPGYSHRNYQRLNTAVGLEYAEQAGCTHVLKWRTDMLPTLLNVDQLLRWSDYRVPDGMSSRLVTSAFRNLTVVPDWFSSIPDLFAFGSTSTMRLLWGREEFDFSLAANLPASLVAECGTEWLASGDAGGIYCAETELYALFRQRLEKKLAVALSHTQIVLDYLRLIDHNRLGICWFGAKDGFRSIFQAPEHPWWTEENWVQQESPKPIGMGYSTGMLKRICMTVVRKLITRGELAQQRTWYKNFVKMRPDI